MKVVQSFLLHQIIAQSTRIQHRPCLTMRWFLRVLCQLLLIWVYNPHVRSLDVAIPETDVYRTGTSGNWASSYSASRHARWSAIYSDIFANWQKPFRVKSRVVAVITTTPNRIADIRVVIDSLLKQSYPADTIYFFVPHTFRRDGSNYNVPAWVEEYHANNKIALVRCADRGPGTDVLSALELETDPETFIFKVDDDQVYGKDTLNLLLRSAAVMPGRAISSESTQYYPHTNGVILQGVHGMIFQRKLFDDTIFDYSIAGNWSHNCWLHDDLWYSMHFAKKGIRRESLEMRLETRALELAWSSSALYLGGAGTDNYQNIYLCNAAVLQVYPHLWQPRYRIVLITRYADGIPLDQLLKWIGSQSRIPHHVHAFGFPTDVKHQRFGDWMDGVVFTFHEAELCGKCDAHGILEAVIEIEEDSEAILIAGPIQSLERPDIVENSFKCVTQRAVTDFPSDCSMLAKGLVAFWRGTIGAGIFLANVTQSIFDEPKVADIPPHVDWEPVEDSMDYFNYLLDSSNIERWRSTAEYVDGRKPTLVIVIHTSREDMRQAENQASVLLYHATVAPDHVYVCVETASGSSLGEIDSSDPRATILEFRNSIESLEGVCRLECPRAFILSMPTQHVSRVVLQIFVSLSIKWQGFAIGSHGIRYHQVSPIPLGAVLYPPGLLDITLSQEGRNECNGAEDLWIWLNLNGRGAKALTLESELAQRIMAPNAFALADASWKKCFDFLWPQLGVRFHPDLPRRERRVALFLRPPASSLLNVLPPKDRGDFARHWAELDINYLLSQQRYPDAVYVLDDGKLHGHTNRWIGGINGFSVRVISCASCADFEQFKAGMGLEWHPDTVYLFATAERLLSDMLVLENLRCADKLLRVDNKKYCGYPMHKMGSHRLMEMAMLRGQIHNM